MDGLPVHQLDGNFSATNSLSGKAGEAVADGVAEQAIERRLRYAIQCAARVEKIVPQSYSHRDRPKAVTSRTQAANPGLGEFTR